MAEFIGCYNGGYDCFTKKRLIFPGEKNLRSDFVLALIRFANQPCPLELNTFFLEAIVAAVI